MSAISLLLPVAVLLAQATAEGQVPPAGPPSPATATVETQASPGAPSPPAPPAAAPETHWFDLIAIDGLVDTYFMYRLSGPFRDKAALRAFPNLVPDNPDAWLDLALPSWTILPIDSAPR